MKTDKLRGRCAVLLFAAASSWSTLAGGDASSPADRRSGLPCILRGTYAVSSSQWHDAKLETAVGGEIDLPAAVAAAFARGRVGGGPPASWNVPEDAAAAFARELLEAIELRPEKRSIWMNWMGYNPEEQERSAGASLTCTLLKHEQSGGRRLAAVGVTGTLATTTSGRMGSRDGSNWWNDKFEARLEGHVLVDKEARTVTGVSLVIRGRQEGRYHQPAGGTGEDYVAKLLVRVDALPADSRQDADRHALVLALAREGFAQRKEAVEKARALPRPAWRALIAELRKSADPELWQAAAALEASGAPAEAQAKDAILWFEKKPKTEKGNNHEF